MHAVQVKGVPQKWINNWGYLPSWDAKPITRDHNWYDFTCSGNSWDLCTANYCVLLSAYYNFKLIIEMVRSKFWFKSYGKKMSWIFKNDNPYSKWEIAWVKLTRYIQRRASSCCWGELLAPLLHFPMTFAHLMWWYICIEHPLANGVESVEKWRGLCVSQPFI
jgi:hypothetical protein